MPRLWPKSSELTYDAALRGFLCMLPMVFALVVGKTEWIVPLGQGGFFFSIMPILPKRWERLVNILVTLGLGLGFYLIGGNSTVAIGLAVMYAFIAGFVSTMLTSWRYLGMGAISMVMPIYAAGLNAGSPEKAASSFVAFSVVIAYCGLITLLPFWKAKKLPEQKQVSEKTRTLSAIKLGIGASIALFLSEIWNFSKLGWAPSAVASVVRPEELGNKARKRALVRAGGVVVGGIIAGMFLTLEPSFTVATIFVVTLAMLNGLISYTALGQIPIMYNAVILVLYSQIGGSQSEGLIDIRILYNVIGILIALAIVYYPLPIITRKIEEIFASAKNNK